MTLRSDVSRPSRWEDGSNVGIEVVQPGGVPRDVPRFEGDQFRVSPARPRLCGHSSREADGMR